MKTTQTANGRGVSAVRSPVYFLVSMLEGIGLGYDMRGDFPAHSHGTRSLETAREWKNRIEEEHADLRGHLHIMATESFVLDERAKLTAV